MSASLNHCKKMGAEPGRRCLNYPLGGDFESQGGDETKGGMGGNNKKEAKTLNH